MAAKAQTAIVKQAATGGNPIERVKLFWAGRSTQQRVYLAAGLALTLGVAAFFVKDDGDTPVQATDVRPGASRCTSDHR